ncbi:MAG: TetR/AcrR family transcriptional regulator [Chloroflexi bacterium]|jgi:AcrR family transcriptional regulator|nr:TetR/AcrR family transcriptional regulator [Chloroflexota bacterium]
MPRYSQEQRQLILQETRSRLLAAAVQVFARQGYENANINHISETAGYAKGTVYNYFASKQELMLAVLDDVGQAHGEFIAGRVRAAAGPLQRLEQFFVSGFDYVAGHPDEARVLITTLYSADLAFRQRLAQIYLPMFELVAREIISAGQEQGLFRDVNPMATGSMLMTLYLGTCSQVDEQGRPYLDPLQVADFARHAIQKTTGQQ